MINWQLFDWQSFSTLTTGALAVAGATIVGLKQAAISARQTEILNRQTELEELKHRADLFDRRYAAYQATAEFVRRCLFEDPLEIDKAKDEFHPFVGQSLFIFNTEIHEQLYELYAAGAYIEICAKARANNDTESVLISKERETEYKDALTGAFFDLPGLFGETMMLDWKPRSDFPKVEREFGKSLSKKLD